MSKEIRNVVITGLVLLLVIVCIVYWAKQQKDAVGQKQAEISALEAQIKQAEKTAAEKADLEKELKKLEGNLSHYITILPSPEVATKENLMRLVQEKCERSQFRVERYVTKGKAKKSTAKTKSKGKKGTGGGFQEIPLTLDATGTFEQYLRFLNSLERHESFLRVNSFNCRAPSAPEINVEDGTEIWPLKISLTLSTFRYEAGKGAGPKKKVAK